MMTGAKPTPIPLEVVMMAGSSLTVVQREDIFSCLVLDRDMSCAEIARRVGIHSSTVSRELARNGGRHEYRPSDAEARAVEQRRRPKPALSLDSRLGRRVRDLIKAGYSPAGTARILADEELSVATETIYQAVYTGRLGLDPRTCLRTLRPRRRRRHDPATPNPSGNYLGDFTPIKDRPDRVETRQEAGHWEGDLIIGARNQSAMITLIERVSRFTQLIALPHGYRTPHVVAAVRTWLETLPLELRCSLTWDRGAELANWPDLSDLTHVYFCDPRSPWQRGSNEQNNRTLRFWLPRGTDLRHVDPEPIMTIINTQPRRILNWATPTTIYNQSITVR